MVKDRQTAGSRTGRVDGIASAQNSTREGTDRDLLEGEFGVAGGAGEAVDTPGLVQG